MIPIRTPRSTAEVSWAAERGTVRKTERRTTPARARVVRSRSTLPPFRPFTAVSPRNRTARTARPTPTRRAGARTPGGARHSRRPLEGRSLGSGCVLGVVRGAASRLVLSATGGGAAAATVLLGDFAFGAGAGFSSAGRSTASGALRASSVGAGAATRWTRYEGGA